MGSPRQSRPEQAIAALAAAATAPILLRTAAHEFVHVLDAAACLISRLVGEVLIEVAEAAVGDQRLTLGQGFLVPDYPATQAVLDQDRAEIVSLLDPDPEPTEARLLRQLGFDSLLMVPLTSAGSRWGLVEIYANGRRFSDGEAEAARALAHVVGERLEQLPTG